MARIVVPPGDVTASRSSTGCMCSSRSSTAVPSIVWTTSCVETSRERPSRMPASIIASASRAKYAGPEPDTAVTASMYGSATSTTGPRCASTSRASATFSSVACAPAHRPVIPSCTVAGAARHAALHRKSRSGSARRRRALRQQPLRPPEQHVHAGQAGPLSVRREQLLGLPALDATAAHRRQEFDEAEVADQPEVVAAETLERDDAYRPWPEAALAAEPRRYGLRRKASQPLEVERRADADERRRPPGGEAEPP